MNEPDLMRSLYDGYAAINPRDRRDTEVHLSTATANYLALQLTMTGGKFDMENWVTGATLLGRPARCDEGIPFGEFRWITENAQERAMRRIRGEFGDRAINVMQPLAMDWPVPSPAPKPTLRALLKHWLKRSRS